MIDVPKKMEWWDIWPSGDNGGPNGPIRGSREKAEIEAQYYADTYGRTVYLHRVTSKRVAVCRPATEADSEDPTP